MGVNWAAGLIRWRPHTSSDGRTYSLAHLHPFQFACTLPSTERHAARTITINVGFGLHVFTCALSSAGQSAEEYRDDRERRAFDCERYEASLQLESLVRALEERKCHFAARNNFVTTETRGAPAGYEYRVFFAMQPDRTKTNTVTLIVQSAYFAPLDWDREHLRRKPVGFRVILLNTLMGKPLREPP
jgi:hypothetical protein